jgi:hypothetical protein
MEILVPEVPAKPPHRPPESGERRDVPTLSDARGAYGRIAVTLLVKRPGAGQGLARIRHREARAPSALWMRADEINRAV